MCSCIPGRKCDAHAICNECGKNRFGHDLDADMALTGLAYHSFRSENRTSDDR